MRGKARMADFLPFRDRALHKDGAGMSPPPTAPVTFPSPLSARGGRGCCRLGRCGRRPARRERLRDARPVVSLCPGPDIRMPRAQRARSATSPGPAPPAGDPGGSARPRPAARPPAPLGSALALAF
ncbi:sterile alpha motif domain-containing protein 1-like [Macaca nemestrina]|uniref:sterile alpha motif domain-containing protein 1-like n=1 Tax=Macaca nemestrina TaxID=9545 RepID=UPI0039B832C0